MKLPSLSSSSSALALGLGLAQIPAPTSAAEMILYNSLTDGLSSTGSSLINGRSLSNYCTNPDTPTGQYAGWDHAAILQFCTDPWMGGGLRLPTNPQPAAATYGFVTFLARAEYAESCMPTFSMTCGWWPRYNTKSIELSGSYVAGGSLDDTDWRRVVIPTSDLISGSSCDGVTGYYSVNFGKCNPPPKYWVTDIRLTDEAPSFGSTSPTESPTEVPTIGPTEYSPTVLWESYDEDPDGSCLDARNNSTQVQSSPQDYLQLITDPWKGATLQIRSHCYFPHVDRATNPLYNHFTDPGLNLVFELKASGNFGSKCDPAVSMSGGSWIGGVGWSGRSPAVVIDHERVDYGEVSDTEYRTVVISMEEFKEGIDWDLDSVHSISFHYCSGLGLHSSEEQPKYYVRNMQVTKRPPTLMTPYPTFSPTVRVTEDPSMATHRMIHHHWYPMLDDSRDASTWLDAVNNAWPSIPADAADHEYTVHVPMGSVVTYSASSNVKLDKVVVHGTLNIEPNGAHVLLTCGTLVVEMMGTLNIVTQQDGHTVTIDIDGALDTATDPEQTLVGVINLGGTVTIAGDPVQAKMLPLKSAIAAGGTSLVLDDPSGTASSWKAGDELVLPDTKEGQDVDWWGFSVEVPGETERAMIDTLSVSGSELHITLQNPTQYGHIVGCHAAHVSRSIVIKTSDTSADRGHVMHTGMGKFDVSNARFESLGRTEIDTLDNTVLESDGTELAMGLARMNATHIGTNQIARYALHSHHSMIKVNWSGNAILESPRNCMVMHNSFGDITDNVAVGCTGTGIFLESGTESGLVEDNFLIGTGGGSRGHDDGRFATGGGQDMAHGGFGIWARGMLAPIRNNRAEGIFARSPYAMFVHPQFVQDNVVPMVEGTNPALAGKSLKDIFHHEPVQLETYGPFIGNSAFGSWRSALDLSYFGRPGVGAGHVIEDFKFTSLASSGHGIFFVHSFAFDLVDGNYEAVYPGNEIVGEFCNNGDPGVVVYKNNTVFTGFSVIRGGNC